MEYNKKQFKSVGCKKVLHKINKSWVTISVALLGVIGGAWVHADNANAANVSHLDNNDAGNRVTSQRASGSAQHATLVNEAGTAQSSSVNASRFNNEQISQATASLQNRIVRHAGSADVNQPQSLSSSRKSLNSSLNLGRVAAASGSGLTASSSASGSVGTITLQYLLNHQVVHQISLHRKVGSDFSLTYYLVHVPKGLSIKKVLGNGDEVYSFTSRPQTIQITVNKTAASQMVHATIEYIDTSNHNRVVGDPVKLSGPLGQSINYSKYESQAPLGFQAVGLGQSDPYLEDGDVDKILVKEISSGPDSVPASSSSSDSAAFSADRSQFTVIWSRAQSDLGNAHLQADSELAGASRSEQAALSGDSSAFQAEMSATGSAALESASGTIQAASLTVNSLGELVSTADSSYASAQIASEDFRQLSASLSSQVTAAEADTRADGQRIEAVAGTTGSVSAQVQSLAVAEADNQEVARDRGAVLSAASAIDTVQQDLLTTSQALNSLSSRISVAAGQHDLTSASAFGASVTSYDQEVGFLVDQVNQADVKMTQAASKAASDGQHPAQPVQNADQIVLNFTDPDAPQRSFTPQVLHRTDARQLLKNLIQHVLQNNAAGLINDRRNFNQLLDYVPVGYGIVGVRTAQLEKTGLAMTLQIRAGAQSSLHEMADNLKLWQIYYQDAVSGRRVSSLQLSSNRLQQLFNQGRLKDLLVPNDNYTYAKLTDAQINSNQPIVTIAVRSKAASSGNNQFQPAIQSDMAKVTSASAQMASEANDPAVREDPSVAAPLSSAAASVQQASSAVRMDLLDPDRIAMLNAGDAARSASDAAVSAHGLLLTARHYVASLSDQVGRALSEADTDVNNLATISSQAATAASIAGPQLDSLSSLTKRANPSITVQLDRLWNRANQDDDQIKQFNDDCRSAYQKVSSWLNKARTSAASDHDQQALQWTGQINTAMQAINDRKSQNDDNVSDLQRLVAEAKNQLNGNVKPTPQPNQPNHRPNDANAGEIKVIYVDGVNHVVSSAALHGTVGQDFDLDDYVHSVPSGYRFSNVLLGSNVHYFTGQPQTVVIECISASPSSGAQQPSSAVPSASSSAASSSSRPNPQSGSQSSSNSVSSNSSISSSSSSAVPSSSASSSASSGSSASNESNSGSSASGSTDGDQSGEDNDGDDDDSDSTSDSPAASNESDQSASPVASTSTGTTANDSDGVSDDRLPKTGEINSVSRLGLALLALSATLISLGGVTDRRRQD